MVYETDIIIISYNNFSLIDQCIDSVLKSEMVKVQNVIVVDNASTDNTVACLREKYNNIMLIENPANYGYAKAVNIGLEHCISDYTIISNNDVVYDTDTIFLLTDYLAKHEDAGAVGPKQRYPDGRLQYMGGELPSVKLGLKDLFFLSGIKLRLFGLIDLVVRPDAIRYGYIDGAVIACKTGQIKLMGGLDEEFFFYSEEADFCKRLKDLNKSVCIVPRAEIIHYRGAATGSNINPASIRMLIDSQWLYCKKHLSQSDARLFAWLEYLAYSLKAILGKLTGKADKSASFREYSNNWMRILKERNEK